MTRKRVLLLGAALAVALACPPSGEAGEGAKKKKKAEPTNYLEQLQARFQAWDGNGDGVLDKQELAKAFRDADARPFDDKGQPAGGGLLAGDGKVKPISTVLVLTPVPALSVNYSLAELLTRVEPPAVPPPPANVAKLPDYQFLMLLGVKNKTSVAKQDFDTWAGGLAQQLQQRDQLERQVQKAQVKVQKAKGKKAKQRAQQELQRHVADLTQVTAQLSAIPPPVAEALQIKLR